MNIIRMSEILYNIHVLQWHHNEHDGISNHQRLDGLFNRLFRRRSKKISKLRITGLWGGELTGDQWIPLTKGQLCENFLHLMTSSSIFLITCITVILTLCLRWFDNEVEYGKYSVSDKNQTRELGLVLISRLKWLKECWILYVWN